LQRLFAKKVHGEKKDDIRWTARKKRKKGKRKEKRKNADTFVKASKKS